VKKVGQETSPGTVRYDKLPQLTVKAIFSEGSLKLCALESIFSEWIHWKYRSNILFSANRSLKLWALKSIFS